MTESTFSQHAEPLRSHKTLQKSALLQPTGIECEDDLPLSPHAVYNIGGGTPQNLLDFVTTLQQELVWAHVLLPDYDFAGRQELTGMQPGDAPSTFADSKALEKDYGFKPGISIRDSLCKFVDWYKEVLSFVNIKAVQKNKTDIKQLPGFDFAIV